MFTHIASHPCSELHKKHVYGAETNNLKRDWNSHVKIAQGCKIQKPRADAAISKRRPTKRFSWIVPSKSWVLDIKWAFVMFIDQYLKRSANLFAENTTASPFKESYDCMIVLCPNPCPLPLDSWVVMFPVVLHNQTVQMCKPYCIHCCPFLWGSPYNNGLFGIGIPLHSLHTHTPLSAFVVEMKSLQ